MTSYQFPIASALLIAATAIAAPVDAQQLGALARQKTDSTTARPSRLLLRNNVAASRPSPQGAPAQSGAYMNIGFSGLVDAGWSSTADVQSLQRGDHDPAVRGFTIT